jgi:predicted ATPase
LRLYSLETSPSFGYHEAFKKGKHVPSYRENFFVITGGPGTGKSSLLAGIQRQGYLTTPEAGRGIIQDQVAIAGHGLPWDDRKLFAELMLCWDMRSYRVAEHNSGIVFFDRGVIDVLGYLRLSGLPVPEYVRNAANLLRYNRMVFIAPPWRDIFHQDQERKQDFEEAVRTHDALVKAYRDQDYDLIELPCVSVDERIEFVIDRAVKLVPE